jgi:hypothetical protein
MRKLVLAIAGHSRRRARPPIRGGFSADAVSLVQICPNPISGSRSGLEADFLNRSVRWPEGTFHYVANLLISHAARSCNSGIHPA